jgi:hypothetical protein
MPPEPAEGGALQRPDASFASGPVTQRVASFVVPPLTAVALLYAVLAELQITVLRPETLLLVAVWLGGGVALGLVASFGRKSVRLVVLSLMVVLWADVTFSLSTVFDLLGPEARAVGARDRRRVADLTAIRTALERHIAEIGPLPRPRDYGEGIGPADFWEGWWDVSSQDGNGDGRPFLEFLVDRGLMTAVPVDPVNRSAADGHPSRGEQYVYFVAPPHYDYQGGQCGAPGSSTWMLAITDLERESRRPPTGVEGSGCECLWRDKPDFFQDYFDYITCGQFLWP